VLSSEGFALVDDMSFECLGAFETETLVLFDKFVSDNLFEFKTTFLICKRNFVGGLFVKAKQAYIGVADAALTHKLEKSTQRVSVPGRGVISGAFGGGFSAADEGGAGVVTAVGG
jgi:hypothetical protein